MEKRSDLPLFDEKLLDVRNFSAQFKSAAGTLHAVDHLNFSLRKGEILAIVGESGSGKTVSMMSMMSLLESPTLSLSGEAFFQGVDLLKMSESELARVRGSEIGFLFQNPLNSLNPVMAVGSQVAEAPLLHGIIEPKQAKEYALGLLDQMGIRNPAERYSDYPHQFSGGERQRIMIAIAMSCSPKLLIADEPTTSLDVTVEKKILKLLSDLRQLSDLSIILITHDLNIALGFADRVAVMYGGTFMEIGTPYDLLSNPLHPYTYTLLNARLGLHHRERDYSAKTLPPEWPAGCYFQPQHDNSPFVSRSLLMRVEGGFDHQVNQFMLTTPDDEVAK